MPPQKYYGKPETNEAKPSDIMVDSYLTEIEHQNSCKKGANILKNFQVFSVVWYTLLKRRSLYFNKLLIAGEETILSPNVALNFLAF